MQLHIDNAAAPSHYALCPKSLILRKLTKTTTSPKKYISELFS